MTVAVARSSHRSPSGQQVASSRITETAVAAFTFQQRESRILFRWGKEL